MEKTTEQKMKDLMKDLKTNNPVGLALMYERILTSADDLRRHAAELKAEEKSGGKVSIIHPDLMIDYADRVKKNLEG